MGKKIIYANACDYAFAAHPDVVEAKAEEFNSFSVLPADAKERKTYPLYTGCLKYFPDALAVVSHVSFIGNEQHHPGEPLHWDKSKSTDELDALLRHITEGK